MTTNPVLEAATTTFLKHKHWADAAIMQVNDRQLRVALHNKTNSIAVIMKHIAGNLKSRSTNFLNEDGEKDWRNRDDEFTDNFTDRDELLAFWEDGWMALFQTLNALSDNHLTATITIRGEELSVAQALQRSLGHTCYHIGQIIMVARCVCTTEWKVLTIPRGKSAQFNALVWGDNNYRPLKTEET